MDGICPSAVIAVSASRADFALLASVTSTWAKTGNESAVAKMKLSSQNLYGSWFAPHRSLVATTGQATAMPIASESQALLLCLIPAQNILPRNRAGTAAPTIPIGNGTPRFSDESSLYSRKSSC
ncbi:hypothetical protein D9M72_472050 [compost metagenome]